LSGNEAVFDVSLKGIASCLGAYGHNRSKQPDPVRSFRDAGTRRVVMTADFAMPILVVDDYHTMVRIIRNLLKQIGFENVDDAANGEIALQKIKERRYGLIISDWNMEPMTGFQLLQKVREERVCADVPFIMVTAESKTDNVVAARRAGVSHYIVKPFNAATLKAKIDAVFASAAAA
jgi:two-component system chemotaxis response regulator CheY